MVSTKPHTECFGCAEQSGVGGLLGLQGIEGLFFFFDPYRTYLWDGGRVLGSAVGDALSSSLSLRLVLSQRFYKRAELSEA